MSSIPSFVAIKNAGPHIGVFEPVVAGSCVEWSMYFEEETAPGSNVWVPMSFTGITLTAEIRKSIYDTAAIVGGVSATPSVTPGYIDFFIGADITAAVGECELNFGFKVHGGDPTRNKVQVIGTIPVVLAGVR